jgi:hypothetical protein
MMYIASAVVVVPPLASASSILQSRNENRMLVLFLLL